jgi:hypothetical protein
MTYAGHHKDFACYVGQTNAKHDPVAPMAGIWRRISDAVRASHHKQVDGNIANLIAQRGGRITDDLEREITRRLLTSDWSVRG